MMCGVLFMHQGVFDYKIQHFIYKTKIVTKTKNKKTEKKTTTTTVATKIQKYSITKQKQQNII